VGAAVFCVRPHTPEVRMSLDELDIQLSNFISALHLFNESMAKNWDELQRAWEYADELWNDDSARREFANHWNELGIALKLYREQYGEQYEYFLLERKLALDDYFGRR
jgi:hypothetical protein